jgi:hypothetical protein
MLAGYLVALFAYLFAACSGFVLITFINHLDPAETARPVDVVEPRELKLAS